MTATCAKYFKLIAMHVRNVSSTFSPHALEIVRYDLVNEHVSLWRLHPPLQRGPMDRLLDGSAGRVKNLLHGYTSWNIPTKP